MLQITELFPKFNDLHLAYGSETATPIYGAGQINNPEICLIFMNLTAKNVSSNPNWEGIRAPWIGTRNVWMLLHKLGLFNNSEIIDAIKKMKPEEWTIEFAENLYKEIANESLYITNIAKCTQDDARHLPDKVYKEYLPLMLEELEYVNPKIIFTLGNQVSSILLQRQISVSNYLNDEYDVLKLPSGNGFKVYPTYYPIGQGTPNMPKAINRIKNVLNK